MRRVAPEASPTEGPRRVGDRPALAAATLRTVTVDAVVKAHRAAGRFFEAGGVRSFVREQGEGQPVVCMHGVPASCFLYRKVLPGLADRGLRGLAFDLPGLGLADRPTDFDYSWSGLGRFSVAAIDALQLDRFHLIVHDIGGPVGFEVAAALPGRVASLTILNTIIEVDTFRRPWSMEPFAWRGLGPLWLASSTRRVFRWLMLTQGIGDRDSISMEELDAYRALLVRDDGGRAFLEIMRGFERTPEKRQRYVAAIEALRPRVQVLWGVDDPALKVSPFGEIAKRVTGVSDLVALRAKHFLQEDQAPAIAEHVADLVRRSYRAA